MKQTSIEILNAILTILVGILSLIILFCRKMWLKVSRNILKPHFGIETKAYRKWHDKRSAHIQKLLDKEHKENHLQVGGGRNWECLKAQPGCH